MASDRLIKLREKRKQLDALIHDETVKNTAAERKLDTQIKVLYGAGIEILDRNKDEESKLIVQKARAALTEKDRARLDKAIKQRQASREEAAPKPKQRTQQQAAPQQQQQKTEQPA